MAQGHLTYFCCEAITLRSAHHLLDPSWICDLTRSVETEEDRRDVSENPEENLSLNYFYTRKKKWKWVFLSIMLLADIKKRELSWVIVEICPAWLCHTSSYTSAKPQTTVWSRAPLFLTDNTEIINKLYMKNCEENVQKNQTIRDT